MALTLDAQSLGALSPNSNNDIKSRFLFPCLLALELVGCAQIPLTAFIYSPPQPQELELFLFIIIIFFLSLCKLEAESC